MAQIITYHVLTAAGGDALAAAVQNAVRSDWQPFGSVSVTGLKDGSLVFAQAIVQALPEIPKTPLLPTV
jgi:hypothetical protein